MVDQAVAELVEEGGPRDWGPVGCTVALPGLVILLVVPLAARHLGLSSAVVVPLLVAGGLVMVVGLVAHFAAGGLVRGHHTAAAEAGIRGLEAWDPEGGDRVEALRGATLVVMNAMAAYGATTSHTFDPDEVRRRIAPLMPLVEAVEEYLVERGSTYRVFTE